MSDPSASGMRVVVGVTGGIACYKAVGVVRELTLMGHDVHVIPTHSALAFVGAATWEAISHNPVSADVFSGVDQVRHVALGQQADLVIVAPATAHFLAQYARGWPPIFWGQHFWPPRLRLCSPPPCTPKCGITRRRQQISPPSRPGECTSLAPPAGD